MKNNSRSLMMINLYQYKGFKRTAVPAIIFLCINVIVLSGCGQGAVVDSKIQKGYSLPEIMIIATAEKNRYETVCTDQIWGVSVAADGTDFETYLSRQIQSFMEEMKTMNLLAAEKNVSLTAEERANMSEATEEYYKSLSEADIAYMAVTKDDVRHVYEDYCLANKLVAALTTDVNLEVSDSEAKVVTIMQSKADSKELADSLYAAASAENADFQKSAESLGLTVTTRQLGREEESKEFENAAFALTTGQVSSIIADGSSFYVIKCVSDYDADATAARKDAIFSERKRKAFREIYDDFKAGVSLTYSGEPWEKLDLSENEFPDNADFFGIYKKYAQQ